MQVMQVRISGIRVKNHHLMQHVEYVKDSNDPSTDLQSENSSKDMSTGYVSFDLHFKY